MGWWLAFAQQGLSPCKKKYNAELAWRTKGCVTYPVIATNTSVGKDFWPRPHAGESAAT